MITFKKNWLYRYNEWCDGNLCTFDKVNDNHSICPYFWKSLWNLFGANFIYLLLAHVPAVLGVFFEGSSMFEGFDRLSLFYLYVLVGYLMILSFILLVVAVTYVYDLVVRYFKRSKGGNRSVVIEYVKAKKAKICPMIKWED